MATLAADRAATRPFTGYRRVLVPVDEDTAAAVTTACTLAAEHGAVVTALAVVEVPAALPLDADMPEEEMRDALALAEAIGDRRGVRVERATVHTRRAGEAIVDAAAASDADLVVLCRPLDKTARYVLQHAGCRVLFSRPGP